MDERGRGGYHRKLDPMEGEISVYHISLPAVPADALVDPFASCPSDFHWFKLHISDKQADGQKRLGWLVMPFTAVTLPNPRSSYTITISLCYATLISHCQRVAGFRQVSHKILLGKIISHFKQFSWWDGCYFFLLSEQWFKFCLWEPESHCDIAVAPFSPHTK